MALGDYAKIGVFLVDIIKKVSKWIKEKIRREDVQNMEKDIANDNNVSINKRVSKLKRKRKNRNDSR